MNQLQLPSLTQKKPATKFSEKLVDIFSPQFFDYNDKDVKIEGRVLIGENIQKLMCQDSAIIFKNETVLAAGVFDGHGKEGFFISSFVASKVLDLLEENYDPYNLLLETKNSLDAYTINNRGIYGSGTTFTMIFIQPDWSFIAVNVGDSTIIQKGESTKDLFERTNIYDSDSRSFVPIEGYRVDKMIATRNILSDSISPLLSFEPKFICSKLKPNESIYIVSDGIIKTLKIAYDKNYHVNQEYMLSDFSAISSDVDSLIDKIKSRFFSCGGGYYDNGTALAPDGDDISAISITRLR